MDLQDSKSITDCVSAVVAHFGKIDILVNAAGIPGGGDPATLTDEYWLNVINTDLFRISHMYRGTMNIRHFESNVISFFCVFRCHRAHGADHRTGK